MAPPKSHAQRRELREAYKLEIFRFTSFIEAQRKTKTHLQSVVEWFFWEGESEAGYKLATKGGLSLFSLHGFCVLLVAQGGGKSSKEPASVNLERDVIFRDSPGPSDQQLELLQAGTRQVKWLMENMSRIT